MSDEIKKHFMDTMAEATINVTLKVASKCNIDISKESEIILLAEKYGIMKAAQSAINEFIEMVDKESEELSVEAKTKSKDRKKTDKEVDEAKDFAEKLKGKKDIDNPWALSHWMQNKGYDIKDKEKGKKKKSSIGFEGIIIRKASEQIKSKKSGE